jgi:hypothetical protein
MAAGTKAGAALAVGRARVAGRSTRGVQRGAFPGGARSTAATRARCAGLGVRRTRGRAALSGDTAQAAAFGRRSTRAARGRAGADARGAGVRHGVAQLRTAICTGLTEVTEPMTGRRRNDGTASATVGSAAARIGRPSGRSACTAVTEGSGRSRASSGGGRSACAVSSATAAPVESPVATVSTRTVTRPRTPAPDGERDGDETGGFQTTHI